MKLTVKVVVVFFVACLVGGCASSAVAPKLGLQRSLYPGLGDLDASQIPAAFDTKVDLHPPLSGGIVWLADSHPGIYGSTLSEYARTGILKRAVAKLKHVPFRGVASLPTTTDFQRRHDASPAIDAIRGAAARFQYDVAFILQTGLARESGINPFAIGYFGLITAPLFPGTDISVAAAAELCAVDVRSGVMLGCGIGRSYEDARFLFPLSVSKRTAQLREEMVARSVEEATTEILVQIARWTSHPSPSLSGSSPRARTN